MMFRWQVMDMEHELQALRVQLAEKCKYSIQLQKEVSARHSSKVYARFYLYYLVATDTLRMMNTIYCWWHLCILQKILKKFSSLTMVSFEYIYGNVTKTTAMALRETCFK